VHADPPAPQSTLHDVEPEQSTVQPPEGHFTAHDALPPHETFPLAPTVTLHPLVP
jgi:hypothetical protein